MNVIKAITEWYKINCFKGTNEVIKSFDFDNKCELVEKKDKIRERPQLSEAELSDIKEEAKKHAEYVSSVFHVDEDFDVLFDTGVRGRTEIIDEDFKYDYGVSIATLDNPGWGLKIHLRGLKLDYTTFTEIEQEEIGNDWISCKIDNDTFKSYGGIGKLETLIKVFLNWVEPTNNKTIELSDAFGWLNQWFKSYCDGDWEHGYGISIKTIENPGWAVEIDLTDTDLEDKEFESLLVKKGENDWLYCCVEDNFFKGWGDLDKLERIINVFKNWAESSN